MQHNNDQEPKQLWAGFKQPSKSSDYLPCNEPLADVLCDSSPRNRLAMHLASALHDVRVGETSMDMAGKLRSAMMNVNGLLLVVVTLGACEENSWMMTSPSWRY
jgi:hypothetical protein